MQQKITDIYKQKPLAKLDLLDDFLFNALLTYPEYGQQFCRKFLKILFGKEFEHLTIIPQKSYGGRDTGLHGARLKNVFVIFICPYDPFGDDRMIYTIKNQCVENPDLPYEDGARTIFLYTKGTKGRENEALSQLLEYMEHTNRENAVTEELQDIQEMVDVVKEDAEVTEVTVAYMKGFERDQMFLEEGKEIGRKQEQENTLREKARADMESERANAEKARADEAYKKIELLERQLVMLKG